MPDMTSFKAAPPPPVVSPEPLESARNRHLRSAFKLLLVGLALFLVWRLASRVGWREVGERMVEVGPMPLLLSALFLFGRYVAVNLRWSLALHRLGPQPHHLVRILMLFTAALVNHITPAARVLGGILRARYLGRYQSHPFSELYGVVLADQVSHHLVHLVLTWLALVAMAWQLGEHKSALIAGLALLVGGGVGGLAPTVRGPAAEIPPDLLGSTGAVGAALYTAYFMPFITIALLLLLAMVGAVAIARRER